MKLAICFVCILVFGYLIFASAKVSVVFDDMELFWPKNDYVSIDRAYYNGERLIITGNAFGRHGIDNITWYCGDLVLTTAQVYREQAPIVIENPDKDIHLPKNYTFIRELPHELSLLLDNGRKSKGRIIFKAIMTDLKKNKYTATYSLKVK